MMLTCHEMTELVTDFVEHRLAFPRRLSFQLHLAMCRHCRRYVAQIRSVIRSLRALPETPPSPEVRDELLRQFRWWRGPADPHRV